MYDHVLLCRVHNLLAQVLLFQEKKKNHSSFLSLFKIHISLV
jgi:hypothetical protein